MAGQRVFRSGMWWLVARGWEEMDGDFVKSVWLLLKGRKDM